MSEIEEMEAEEVEIEEPSITFLDAQRALRVVQQYVEKSYADPGVLKFCDGLDDAFFKMREKKQKQSQITDFFLFQ